MENQSVMVQINRIFICLVLLLSCIVGTVTAKSPIKLTVATYNIRYANQEDSIAGNGWGRRCPVICDLINFQGIDIFGAQEVLVNQLHDMIKELDGYSYIGVGRDDGKEKGEYSPIFYKTAKFKLLNSGHFWLSSNTTYPNKGWDAGCIRICTWGHFEDRQTKWRFWYFNLHMDNAGVVARSESAKLVVSKIRDLCKKESTILTGDFNVDQNDGIYIIFTNSGILKDTYVYAKHRFAENGTFNDFNAEMKTDSRIDHIFVSPFFTVKNYAVLTDCYWSTAQESSNTQKSDSVFKEIKYQRRLPSDHYPVVARVEHNY